MNLHYQKPLVLSNTLTYVEWSLVSGAKLSTFGIVCDLQRYLLIKKSHFFKCHISFFFDRVDKLRKPPA